MMQNLNIARFAFAILLTPLNFSKPDPESPNFDAIWAEDREKYWKNWVVENEVVDMIPIYPKSWSVAEEDLRDQDLEKLLRGHLAKNQFDKDIGRDFLDGNGIWEFPFLYGGVHVLLGDEIVFEPQCCTDMSRWDEWPTLLDWEDQESGWFWVGHPIIYCRRRGEELQFTPHRDQMGEIPDELFCYRMDRAVFAIKL
jgi:hypothetical protein